MKTQLLARLNLKTWVGPAALGLVMFSPGCSDGTSNFEEKWRGSALAGETSGSVAGSTDNLGDSSAASHQSTEIAVIEESEANGDGSDGASDELRALASSDASSGNGTDDDREGSDNGSNGKGSAKNSAEKEDINADDVKRCASQMGVAAERLKMSGNQGAKRLTLREGDGFIARVNGNRNQLSLSLPSRDGGMTLKGLCLVVSGNQAKIMVDTALSIENVVYIGSGNGATAQLSVAAGATISRILSRTQGSAKDLEVRGEGTYPSVESMP